VGKNLDGHVTITSNKKTKNKTKNEKPGKDRSRGLLKTLTLSNAFEKKIFKFS